MLMESGGDLSSRAVSSQVLSALKGLTSVFGMGTGGTPSPLPPEIVYLSILHTLTTAHLMTIFISLTFSLSLVSWSKALDLLVSTTCMCYHTSSVDLSPGSPPGVLLPLRNGSLILEVGFTLRCFQRLSHPHFASLLCRWHDNSCTSGASIPVLSY